MVAARTPKPPTAAEIRRATDAIRRPDGSVDACAAAARLARPLGIRKAMAARALAEVLTDDPAVLNAAAEAQLATDCAELGAPDRAEHPLARRERAG